MGLKLCLEVLESRSGEKGFEAQRARFLGADSRECQDGVRDDDDGEIAERVEIGEVGQRRNEGRARKRP
jgi:hypothetical protein